MIINRLLLVKRFLESSLPKKRKLQAFQKPERSTTTFWSVERPMERGRGEEICSSAGTDVEEMAQSSLELAKILIDTLT